MKVGVLALQGAFREHAEALTALGADVALVKRPEHLDSIDAIFLPGGESTTIDKLLDSSELRAPLTRRLRDGLPTFATCAGLILCATDVVDGRPDQMPLGVLDVTVRRNGYGRQRESFEAPLAVRALRRRRLHRRVHPGARSRTGRARCRSVGRARRRSRSRARRSHLVRVVPPRALGRSPSPSIAS